MMSPLKMNTHQYQHPTATMESIPVHLTGITTGQQRSKRRVSFKPMVTVHPVESLSINQGQKSTLYYNKEEMSTFSQEVKAIQTLSRKLMLPGESFPCSAHAAKRDCMLGLEADPSLRGLELKLCPIRVRNKLLAERFLLNYQGVLRCDSTKSDEEKRLALAGVSAKLSQWSRLVAMETARVDSQQAYEREYLIPISPPVTILPFPVHTSKKSRVACGDGSQQPSKKRRL